MPPLSIPARTFRLIPAKAYDGKITQAIPPPPPYHASVRNAIHRNEINQITTQIQQSCSRNMINVSTTSSSTVTTNINAINASNSSDFADQSSIKQSTQTEMDVSDSDNMQMGEIITADDFDMQNDVSDQLELESSSIFDDDDGRSATLNTAQNKQGSKQVNDKHGECSTADTSTATATTSPATTTKTTAATATTTSPTTSAKELRNSVKQEITDASAMDIDSISEKRANGLKVISNVQVSPNAILNVSLNSTTSTAPSAAATNETNSLNNMIIVSSLPSTSTGLTTSQQQQSQLPQLSKPQSLLKNLNESRTTSETRNSKHTKGNSDVSINIFNIFCVSEKGSLHFSC